MNKEEIKISSYIAKCEACAHWFCMDSSEYKKCSFCGKTEKLKYHNNPKGLYEFSGAIVENRWRWFSFNKLSGIERIDLLCSDGCMLKLLKEVSKNYKVKLQLCGTYWQDKELKKYKKFK